MSNVEASSSLKVYMMLFVLLLVGTMTYFVTQQNRDLDLLYSSLDAASAEDLK